MMLSPKQLRAEVLAEVRAAPPIAPVCRHAPPNDLCGGCALQDRPYAAQTAAKLGALHRMWAALLPPEQIAQFGFVVSPNPLGYRTRMDYVCSKGRIGLRRGGKFNHIIDLTECHLIPPPAFAVARAVWQHALELGLPDYDLRAHTGFLRYVTIRRSPDEQLLVVLVTKTTEPQADMEALAAFALTQPGVLGVHWLHNPAVTDLAGGEPVRHWGAATLPMRVGPHTLQMAPGTFFQNNIHLLLPLLDDVLGCVVGEEQRPTTDERPPTTDHRPAQAAGDQAPLTVGQFSGLPPAEFPVVGRRSSVVGEVGRQSSTVGELIVADLYGGVGTIALHLAAHVGRVVCVESVGESTALAQQNVAAAGAGNVAIVEQDVGAYLRTIAATGARPFAVAVVDPPRGGMGEQAAADLLRLRPRRIVYVSCNPLTQVADAQILLDGYRLTALRGYDMFPQTPHLESLAVFDLI